MTIEKQFRSYKWKDLPPFQKDPLDNLAQTRIKESLWEYGLNGTIRRFPKWFQSQAGKSLLGTRIHSIVFRVARHESISAIGRSLRSAKVGGKHGISRQRVHQLIQEGFIRLLDQLEVMEDQKAVQFAETYLIETEPIRWKEVVIETPEGGES